MTNDRLNTRNTWKIGLIAVIAGLVAFLVWGYSKQTSTGHSDKAYVPNVETIADSSAIIVKGTVLDEGTPRNLRRDSEDPRKEASTVVPGTDYIVKVEEVIKGDLSNGAQIQVAVSGGKYKGKSEPLNASITPNHSYYFFLIPSSMGAPYFFGAGEPFIFESVAGKVQPISNDKEYLEVFKDIGLMESEFLEKARHKSE